MRLGVSASRSMGTAVRRNRAKRRLREAFRPLMPDLAGRLGPGGRCPAGAPGGGLAGSAEPPLVTWCGAPACSDRRAICVESALVDEQEPRLRDIPVNLGTLPRLPVLALIRAYQTDDLAGLARRNLPLPSDLLPLRLPGHRQVRPVQGRRDGDLARAALPAVQLRRIRPRPIGALWHYDRCAHPGLPSACWRWSTLLLAGCSGAAMTPSSWPGVSADSTTAYVASNQAVYAVDLATGAERWRFPATARPCHHPVRNPDDHRRWPGDPVATSAAWCTR